MAELLQHLLNGLVLGGTYALLGIGLTLIFGLMNVVNFAHGEFYTLGAYVSFAALALAGAGFFVALLAAIVVGAALGWLCEVALLRRSRSAPVWPRRRARSWVRSSSSTRRWVTSPR